MQGEVLADTIAYIKKKIDRNTNLKILNIRWFGGEPLMNMDAIRKISNFAIPYCEATNIEYYTLIISNGYYLTKSISVELKELKVEYAQIALDGFEATYRSLRAAPSDAYNTVQKNIENSVLPIVIRLNTTRNSQNEIIELA